MPIKVVIGMTKPLIFLTRILPDEAMETLKRRFDLHYHRSDLPISKQQILRGVRYADGIITMLSDRIDREVFEAATRLKIIANYAVGYNNIDLNTANERNIVVTNTPGVLTETTADLAWSLLMAVARRIPEADQLVRSGKWLGWAPTQLLGSDIQGKTLGIIGMGRIGQAMARRAHGFSMRVVYYQRHRLPAKEEKKLHGHYLPLPRLLKESDYVSLHLPLTNESHYLIDKKALHLMKPTAFLINTARGPVVDEKALVNALLEKEIAGAGLDVFEDEPNLAPRLRRLKNTVILPHIGSASTETRIRMGFIVLENLSAYFSKQNPPNMVN
ncbi:MAG: 2-hydroxyacid dehydrogenase [Nitrospiria bacterium]